MIKVSILLPVYNSERFLAQAIESIRSQSISDWELLLLYDHSKDNSLEICKRYAAQDQRVVLIENTQGPGLARCLNLGIKKAQGAFVARMDSDDLSSPQRLQVQMETLLRHPDVVAVGCDIEIIDEQNKITGHRTYDQDDAIMRRKIFFFSPFCHPALMFRKEALDKIAGYDESYRYGEDLDLYFRLGSVGKFMNIRETLFRYRIVSSSTTHTNTAAVERITIHIRDKYKNKNGFYMSPMAWLYNRLHSLALYLTPAAFRTQLFYLLRNR